MSLLRRRADCRSVGFLGALTILLGLQWPGLGQHWGLLPPTCVLVFIACIVKHNHIHCRTFVGNGCNLAFSAWLSLLTGTPTTGIITVHNELHHGHNQSEQDFVRCSLVEFHCNWLNLLTFPFVSLWTMYRQKQSDLARWRTRRPTLYRQAIAERAMTYGFMVVVLILDWRAALTYLVGPWLFGQWALITINLLQHQDCEAESVYDHSRNITGTFINWLFLNNGFHTAHHMRPALHWSRLAEFHRRVIEPRNRRELNQRSLVVAVWRQFFSMRRGNH